MRCNKCGNQLRDGATFCNRCGAPVGENKTAGSDAAEQSVSGKRRVIMIVSAIAVVTAAIALTVFLILSARNNQSRAESIVIAESLNPTVNTQIDIEEPTEKPTEETTEKPGETQAETAYSITVDELEKEIERIRSYYYTPGEDDSQVVLENGTDAWSYSRDYRFHNGKLVFAFIFNGTEEHRLYFKDDHMIRYIDENGVVYDYPDTSSFKSWEEKALSEAYQKETDAPSSADTSEWLGTWRASTGESLEIDEILENGLRLTFHKFVESGSLHSVDYVMEFDNAERTIASEVGGAEDHGGWEYTFVLHDDRITVKSRYPDQEFYKQ